MKTKLVPGEFGFKALVKYTHKKGWLLSDIYFFNQKEVTELLNENKNMQAIWPIEVLDNQTVYVPDQSELE